MNAPADTPWTPDWSQAPEGWDWLAQDADGRWFWYRSAPQLFWAGGLWRANSRNQQLAGQLGIRSIPSLILFKNGREVARQSGALPLQQLTAWLRSQGISA